MADIASLPAPQMPSINAQKDADALRAAAKSKDKVAKAAHDFEAVYMQQMLSHMWEGIETDGPFGGGHGEEVFRSMMIEQYGKMIADSGQTKIASTLQREMLRMQEQQQNPQR